MYQRFSKGGWVEVMFKLHIMAPENSIDLDQINWAVHTFHQKSSKNTIRHPNLFSNLFYTYLRVK